MRFTRWAALTRYVDDGCIEIDNNATERALRVVALGRKNYLFAGSDASGHSAASIYSLLGSVALNGLGGEALTLRIELRGSAPLIYRTILVPANITLRKLHVTQAPSICMKSISA